MLIQILLLAVSSSIDSLGVGMVYGFRHTRISRFSMFIIFIISLAVSFFSTIIGNFVNSFISPNVSSAIGSCILCVIGISIVFKCIFELASYFGSRGERYYVAENTIAVSKDNFSSKE